MYKICGIAVKSYGIKYFMLDTLSYLGDNGFQPYAICEYDENLKNNIQNITYLPLSIKRGYAAPWHIIKNIIDLYRIFRREKFHIIQYTSSNASLVASIAGWLAKVPVRIYCQWGMAYSDYKGFKRFIYRSFAKITCQFSTNVQPDSYANLKYAIEDKLYPASKGNVIFNGSACGVNLDKFSIVKKADWRCQIREHLNISHDAFVFGFLGRIEKDKGLDELFEAFLALNKMNSYLLVVGPEYNINSLNNELLKKVRQNPKVIFIGPVNCPEYYYSAMDCLVLPSYREGFGSVVIEAAAMAVPSICTNIKGPTDFIKDGINGLVCDVKSVESLYLALNRVFNMPKEEYSKLSEKAYCLATSNYDAEKFRIALLKDRLSLINSIT